MTDRTVYGYDGVRDLIFTGSRPDPIVFEVETRKRCGAMRWVVCLLEDGLVC